MEACECAGMCVEEANDFKWPRNARGNLNSKNAPSLDSPRIEWMTNPVGRRCPSPQAHRVDTTWSVYDV